ncbi:putative phospholipid ABC transporter-binding protein MlaD [Aquimixticola soesokkakensis]|uniref:Putative phospholipid ABC transporter-binding protein MlaD n=1 Tax=Aquimixticola soesokkakensis TaxID=1519096 RepID=A0A1Y5T728_9RHOB|nr:outer membrane lipid asymmetry maintenance protein MlaD [Aquimixticola soesokkakensis]SLN57401.1 putative phospholipid ABC transporter-binding protein MlaD [Aquimixticola soesokkakensis]
MSENTTEVIVGTGVLLLAAGFLAYAGQIGGWRGPGGDSYTITASFRSADGVSVGSDVRIAGVRVGTVSDLTLDPATFRAQTTLTLDRAVVLADDTAAIIASEGLLGGNFVELLPGGGVFDLEAGAEIVDTQGAVSLMNLLLKYVTGTGQ